MEYITITQQYTFYIRLYTILCIYTCSPVPEVEALLLQADTLAGHKILRKKHAYDNLLQSINLSYDNVKRCS